MRYQEIAEKVKDGSITLDFCGHRVNGKIERFIACYEDILAKANGSNDGKWSKREDEVDVDACMREFYQQKLDWDAVELRQKHPDFPYHIGHDTGEYYCFHCGRTIRWVHEGDKITLRGIFDGEHKLGPYKCEWSEPKPVTGIIQVSSPLMFVNFFRMEDCPKDKKYSFEFDLNCDRGVENITKYKVGQNVAYGQLTRNYGIFVNKNRDSIILGNPYVVDSRTDGMTDEEYDALSKDDLEAMTLIEGHEMLGQVDGPVWRWEAADINTIKGLFGDDYDKSLSDERFQLEVPHGTWEFQDFNQIRELVEEHDDNIFAKFSLKT